jgi:hypothetical protein
MRGGSDSPGLFSFSSSPSGIVTGLSVTGLMSAPIALRSRHEECSVLDLSETHASHVFRLPPQTDSCSAKPESVRLSFEEPFAKLGSLPTFRSSSNGKTLQTKHYDFQSDPALTD